VLVSALETQDIRFPTSAELDGPDAMNPDPAYSAACVVLRTDHPIEACGHGFAFTIGRGNDVLAKKPLWRFIADMTPEQIVDCIDFRYLSDALTPAEALDILTAGPERPGQSESFRLIAINASIWSVKALELLD
jgi:hypothetical protein